MLSLPSDSTVNVSLEKTEPELSPAWPNLPNLPNVSKEISKNVKQAQELEVTNVLDQHLTNTSIPSKRIPTLTTTRMSTADTETGQNGLNATKIAEKEVKCVNEPVTTHFHKVLVPTVKNLELKVKPEPAHSNNAQSTVNGVLSEASVNAQNHAEVEAKSVPELAPAQPHNMVVKLAKDQPQTQPPATLKLAQHHGPEHETVVLLDVTSRPTTTSKPSKLAESCAIKKCHHANLSTGIQLQRPVISTTVILLPAPFTHHVKVINSHSRNRFQINTSRTLLQTERFQHIS